MLFWTSNRHAFLVTLANYCDSVVKFHVCEDDILCVFVSMWNLTLQPQKAVYPNTTIPMTTNLGKAVTCKDELPLQKSHDPLMT